MIAGILRQSCWALVWICKNFRLFALVTRSDNKYADDVFRFMKPNTPHYEFTLESSICHGCYFYATSTIRDTCYGIIHSFLAGQFISKLELGSEASELLRRLVRYYFDATEEWKTGGMSFTNDSLALGAYSLVEPR